MSLARFSTMLLFDKCTFKTFYTLSYYCQVYLEKITI